MVRQTVLPFKLERTEKKVTARGGLVLFAEFMGVMGVNCKSHTLIIDPTIIESHKREAQMTHLGFKGYRPVVATLITL